jgi:hypothetical protein
MKGRSRFSSTRTKYFERRCADETKERRIAADVLRELNGEAVPDPLHKKEL